MVDTKKQVVIHVIVDEQSLELAEYRCERSGLSVNDLLYSCIVEVALRGHVNLYLKEKV